MGRKKKKKKKGKIRSGLKTVDLSLPLWGDLFMIILKYLPFQNDIVHMRRVCTFFRDFIRDRFVVSEPFPTYQVSGDFANKMKDDGERKFQKLSPYSDYLFETLTLNLSFYDSSFAIGHEDGGSFFWHYYGFCWNILTCDLLLNVKRHERCCERLKIVNFGGINTETNMEKFDTFFKLKYLNVSFDRSGNLSSFNCIDLVRTLKVFRNVEILEFNGLLLEGIPFPCLKGKYKNVYFSFCKMDNWKFLEDLDSKKFCCSFPEFFQFHGKIIDCLIKNKFVKSLGLIGRKDHEFQDQVVFNKEIEKNFKRLLEFGEIKRIKLDNVRFTNGGKPQIFLRKLREYFHKFEYVFEFPNFFSFGEEGSDVRETFNIFLGMIGDTKHYEKGKLCIKGLKINDDVQKLKFYAKFVDVLHENRGKIEKDEKFCIRKGELEGEEFDLLKNYMKLLKDSQNVKN